MEISEVRVKLVERSSERLRAFCSITLDKDFVIRDLKIIDGTNGAFVAMPSRKLADRCTRCGSKNHLRAKFCNECGQKLNENRAPKDVQGRAKLHADVAHPINAECRERIQRAVVEAFEAELERAKSPDYRPPKYDDFDDDIEEQSLSAPAHEPVAVPVAAAPVAAAPVEQSVQEPADESDFSDYNALIAELKREAAGRREKHDQGREGPRGEVAPPRVGQDRGPRRSAADRSERKTPAAAPNEPWAGDQATTEPALAEKKPARSAPPPAPKPPAVPPPPPPSQEEDDFAAGL
jgi:stage V sporulation protein G